MKIHTITLRFIILTILCGCSTDNIQIDVPSFASVNDYIEWGSKHNIQIQLLDSEGSPIEIEQVGQLLYISSDVITPGKILEITVCKKGVSCTLLIENDSILN